MRKEEIYFLLNLRYKLKNPRNLKGIILVFGTKETMPQTFKGPSKWISQIESWDTKHVKLAHRKPGHELEVCCLCRCFIPIHVLNALMFTRKQHKLLPTGSQQQYPFYIELFAALSIFLFSSVLLLDLDKLIFKISKIMGENFGTLLLFHVYPGHAHFLCFKPSPMCSLVALMIFQSLLASNWYWFCRLLLMCSVPKKKS